MTATVRSEDTMSRYDDIINLPHHVSPNRKPMPLSERAAQFAPFAALTGHGAAISETARLTEGQIELSADEAAKLSRRLQYAITYKDSSPELTVCRFIADRHKQGGAYVTVTGILKKYDEYSRSLLLTDGTVVPVADILAVDGEIFRDFE